MEGIDECPGSWAPADQYCADFFFCGGVGVWKGVGVCRVGCVHVVGFLNVRLHGWVFGGGLLFGSRRGGGVVGGGCVV